MNPLNRASRTLPRQRKNYGCPLRIYRCTDDSYLVIPPRAHAAHEQYHKDGRWRSLEVCGSTALPYEVMASTAARASRRRVTWGEVPPTIRATIRASFLSHYCPQEY